ncbi:MAG TPA: phosphoribosylaminoimidazolesuccinocarboxamide synthase, partial [Thermoanaerobaculia bacterium]|nr:phosphoribosylaminoimidazolesuccinocarboxamide synthase [Thermoanaerobaculia bacterium]
MEPRLVSVVLVTWNSARYLRRCLEGVLQQTHDRVELIAVDNASADDSIALVAPHATTVIRNDTNRGFSAAVNQAIAVARGEFLLLLNPDCYLLPDYASRLVNVFAAPDVGSATGLLIRARGTEIEPTEEIDSMGIRMTRNGRHLDIGQGERVGEAVPRFLGSSELVQTVNPRHRGTEAPRNQQPEEPAKPLECAAMRAAVTETSLPFPLARRGKVRDVYDLGDRYLFVATDRISAFDVVLSPGIPDQGTILTQISNFWFRRFTQLENHILESDFDRFPDDVRRHEELRGRSV